MNRILKISFLAVSIMLSALVSNAEIKAVIPNILQSHFPHELVYIDFEYNKSDELQVVTGMGENRPVQLEIIEKDSKKIARAWFIASIPFEVDKKGKIKPNSKVEITFKKGKANPGIFLKKEGDFYIIDNDLYEFKLKNYGEEVKNKSFSEIPHWLGGMRLKGSNKWDGKAFFEGSSKLLSATTEIINQGPVFIDFKITYEFSDNNQVEEQVSAVKMMLGKKSFEYEPNKIPSEMIKKKDKSYELMIRFISGDPWIEVVERYHLPPDKSVSGYGIHQYWIYWGETESLPDIAYKTIPKSEYVPLDTVMYIPWFEYDVFGGNNQLKIMPALPRPTQKGRPFALLRPRWNQGGGGAQEFFLTSKSSTTEGNPQLSGEEDDSTTFGIVAAYPSKWCGPYPATIATYADKKRTCARFPLINGGNDSSSNSELFYGSRAYALCIGKKSYFDTTEKMNGFIRRHTDWTLVANINKYVLEWDRKDIAKSPKIIVNSEQLETLRKEYKSQSSEIMKILKDSAEKDLKKISEIEEKYKIIEGNLKKEEIKLKDTKEKEEQAKLKKIIDKLKNELKDIQNQKKSFEKKTSSAYKIAMLLSKDTPLPPVSENEMPDPGPFLNTRYQDDGCNPTNYGTRRLVNKRFPEADLYSAGSIIGGARQAAIGYIFTDLDSWPGWHNGWQPGNPNFHTDKYIASIFAGALLYDHPHSKEWLEFGMLNLEHDLKKVITPPDGSGYECPGYSGYSLSLQLEAIRTIYNCGFKNIPIENPLIKKTARWHRKLITPYDFRIGKRHEAPLGDTHRWDSGLGSAFRDLAIYYSEKDPEFASELVGTYKLLINSGAKFKENEFNEIFSGSINIIAMNPEKMDWSGEKFEGFGTIFRNNFGTKRESFATFKAGHCRGHYHNDELTYHLYLNNSPVSLDYNCSYHPRGDHAVLHNSLTFGKEGKVKNNQNNNDVKAMEQDFGIGKIIYFHSSPIADIIVAEKSSDTLVLSPIYPEDTEFGREYPSRKTTQMIHRRWFALIKHNDKSKIGDYIVVYDETKGKEEKALNIHLLSRFIEQKGNLFKATGQYDKDFKLFIASESNPKCEIRGWGYIDEFMASPGKEYELKPGESQQDYLKRMEAMGKSLPIGDWAPKWEKDENWQELAKKTNYQSLIPPPNWNKSWLYGEYQQWLRIIPDQNKATLWCLYAFDKGAQEPEISATENGHGIKIVLNESSEEIIINPNGENGQFIIKQNGKDNILISKEKIPAL